MSAKQLEVSVEIMKYVVRHGAQAAFAAESAVMQTVWDDTLVQQYIVFKSQGLQLSVYWAAHKHICSLLMLVADVDKLLAAKGVWTWSPASTTRSCSSTRGVCE